MVLISWDSNHNEAFKFLSDSFYGWDSKKLRIYVLHNVIWPFVHESSTYVMRIREKIGLHHFHGQRLHMTLSNTILEPLPNQSKMSFWYYAKSEHRKFGLVYNQYCSNMLASSSSVLFSRLMYLQNTRNKTSAKEICRVKTEGESNSRPSEGKARVLF